MIVKSMRSFRTFYKENIKCDSNPNRNEHFIGHSIYEGKDRIFGFFDLFHGDKDNIDKFLKQFLDLATDSQTIYEFMQNAHDAEAESFIFYKEKEYLLIFNNGAKFSFESVRSILNIGQSTKESVSNIGRFGVGFKIAHRLLGEDDALREIKNNAGPILFSWGSYSDLEEIANVDSVSSIINTESKFLYNEEIKCFTENENTPWLFKILLTNFPASANESFYDLDFQQINQIIDFEEVKVISDFVKANLINSDCFSKESLNTGSIILIKIAPNKSGNLFSETAKTTITYSLTILNTLFNRSKGLSKVFYESLESQITPANCDYESFHFDKTNQKYDIILENTEDTQKPDKIEILFLFPKIMADKALKKLANIYLYFPLSEENLQLNFILHSNSFHNQSSRTSLDPNSKRNDRIFTIFCAELIERMERYKTSNPEKYNQIFTVILQSDKSEMDNKKWAVEKLYSPLFSYIKNNIPSSNNNYFNKDKIREKDTKLEVSPKEFGVTEYEWFFTNDQELIADARNSSKLGIMRADLQNLVSTSKDISKINRWLDDNSSKIPIFLEELNNEPIIRKGINIKGSGYSLERKDISHNLNEIKFFQFTNGERFSITEIIKSNNILLIASDYKEIEDALIELGYSLFCVDVEKHANILDYLKEYFQYLGNKGNFLEYLSNKFNANSNVISEVNLLNLLHFFKGINSPICSSIVISEDSLCYKLSKKTADVFQVIIPAIKEEAKLFNTKHYNNKFVTLSENIYSEIDNKKDILGLEDLYKYYMENTASLPELIDVIYEADSEKVQLSYLEKIEHIILEEKEYDKNSFEHKIIDLSLKLKYFKIKDKIIIKTAEGKSFNLTNISFQNKVTFEFPDTSQTYELILSKILPAYSESTELVDIILRSFAGLRIENIKKDLLKIGGQKDKEEIFRELNIFIENPHQLAFILLYLKQKNIRIEQKGNVRIKNKNNNDILFQSNRVYYINYIPFLADSIILHDSYSEIANLLGLNDSKPYFNVNNLELVLHPYYIDNVYQCKGVKDNLKDSSEAQKHFYMYLYDQFSNLRTTLPYFDITPTKHIGKTSLVYSKENKKYFFGFDPELIIYPSEYALESEELPWWVLTWLKDGDKRPKLEFLSYIGVNLEQSEVVKLRECLRTGKINVSLNEIKRLYDKNKDYIKGTLYWVHERSLSFIEASNELNCLKDIYRTIHLEDNFPLPFVHSFNAENKLIYILRIIHEPINIWYLNEHTDDDIKKNIKKILEVIEQKKGLLWDHRIVPEIFHAFIESTEIKLVSELITSKAGFQEYEKGYYKLWKTETEDKFRIYLSGIFMPTFHKYSLSFLETKILEKEENIIDVDSEGNIYYLRRDGADLEADLESIIDKNGFTQELLELLKNKKANEPEEIHKIFEKEYDPFDPRPLEEAQKINLKFFPEGDNKTFKEKLLELLEKVESKWKGYIYHFTHIENAVTIINDKSIKARNYANFKDSAGKGYITNTNDIIKNYARFYFRPLTPTQYYNEALGRITKNHDTPKCPVPIFFLFNISEVLSNSENSCYVSNGNLRHYPNTKFDNTYDFLKLFDFQNLYKHYVETDANTFRNASQQEFIVEKELKFEKISDYKIVCKYKENKDTLIRLIDKSNIDINKIIVDPLFYYSYNPELKIKAAKDSLSAEIVGVTIDDTILIEILNRDNCEFIKETLLIDKKIEIQSSNQHPMKIYCKNNRTEQKWLIFTNLEK